MVNNDDRADWAQEAATTFGHAAYCGRGFSAVVADGDGDTLISDLVCDLMHLAKRSGFDAHQLVSDGIKNFEFEITPGNEEA